MIARDDRQMAMALIAEAMAQGARQARACEVVGIASRTYQRWQRTGLSDRRQVVARPPPANKLNEQERQAIIAVCNTDEFGSQSPKQIVPTLADRDIYLPHPEHAAFIALSRPHVYGLLVLDYFATDAAGAPLQP